MKSKLENAIASIVAATADDAPHPAQALLRARAFAEPLIAHWRMQTQ
jgi:hypothetical protein